MLILCDLCKKEFDKKQSKIKISKNNFCSINCRNNFHQIKTNCKFCKTNLSINKSIFEKSKTKNFFCNNSCAASFNNKKRKYINISIKYCLHCGKECKNKYCSSACCAKYQQEQNFKKYENGNYDILKTPVSLKNFLIYKNGYNCNNCGISNWNNKPISLELEHKDGNYKNNSPENIELLCPNCHSQTQTFKGKNKGNGRYKRMDRYYNGKSY